MTINHCADASRRFAKTLTRFLGHGRRDISGGDMAGVADSGEGRFGRKPRARRDVKDAHTRRNAGLFNALN
jgi:hypothetical protein